MHIVDAFSNASPNPTLTHLLCVISKYSESEFSYIFEEGYDTFKIDYSIKPLEVLEFDPSLFITSDDYEIEKTNSLLIYSIKGKDEFIEEYSN